jgi:hypothetical protein
MKVESADHFAELLMKSGLVQRQHYEAWRSKRSETSFSCASDLADSIVADGLITRWQADKLLAGRWKGFYFEGFVITGHVRVEEEEKASIFTATDAASGRRVALNVFSAARGFQRPGIPYYTVFAETD